MLTLDNKARLHPSECPLSNLDTKLPESKMGVGIDTILSSHYPFPH